MKRGSKMLITREIDYALRILRRLSDNKLHVMRDLCEKEIIPQKFAYKILRKRKKAALIKATRGGRRRCLSRHGSSRSQSL